MTITLTQESLQDLNDIGQAKVKNAVIYLNGANHTETQMGLDSSSLGFLRIGITRSTLVRLLNQEVEIDGITLKLIK